MAVDKSEKIPIPARIAPSPPSAPSKVGNPSYIPRPVRIDPSPPPSYESTQVIHGAAISHAPPHPQQPQWQQPIQQPQPQHVSVNINNTSSSAQPAQVVYVPDFGHRPVNMVCPHCKIHIRTGTVSEVRTIAWISCLIMFFTFLWPCCWVPCCISSMKSVTHKCPNCNLHLGRYQGDCC